MIQFFPFLGICEVTSEESETTKLDTEPSTTLRINQAEIIYRAIFIRVSIYTIVTPKQYQKVMYVDMAVIE